jgi:hypothetical protein
MRNEMRPKKSVQEGFIVRQTEGPVSVVVYEPGNGISYKMVVTRIGNPNSPGDIPQKTLQNYFGIARGDYLVNLIHYNRSFFASPDSYLHYIYVREKLGCSVLDAVVIAEAVGTLLNLPHIGVEEYLQAKTG